MGLLLKFGPTPNPAALKEPFEGQRQQIIEVAHVDNPEKESSSADDENVVEDEEMEEESANDDEDYIEERDETSNVSSEIKEKKKGKLLLYWIKFLLCYILSQLYK